MTLRPGIFFIPPLLICLAGCVSPAQQPDSLPSPVAIQGKAAAPAPAPVFLTTERIKADESLFRTTVATESDIVKSSFTTSKNASIPEVTRLESSWTRQLDNGESHLRLGDAISVPGAEGNPVRFAGVQLGTGSGLREDVVPITRLATPGIATLPSSVDALLSSAGATDTPLARQGLVLDGKVQVAGSNSVSFVTRDSLGRTLKVTQPLLTEIKLTERGCGDYAVDLGRVREDFALTSNSYGQWFANTRVLCGIPLGFTVEGHGEYLDRQGGTVGVGLARQLNSIGTASVGLASSRDLEDSGWLARFSFEHTNSLFDLNVRTLVQSAGFRRVGSIPTADPAARSTVASLGMKTGQTSDIAVVYATESTQADVEAALIALTQRMRLSAFNSLTMTAGRSLAATANIMSVYLSFTRAFGAPRLNTSGLPDTFRIIRAPTLFAE